MAQQNPTFARPDAAIITPAVRRLIAEATHWAAEHPGASWQLALDITSRRIHGLCDLRTAWYDARREADIREHAATWAACGPAPATPDGIRRAKERHWQAAEAEHTAYELYAAARHAVHVDVAAALKAAPQQAVMSR